MSGTDNFQTNYNNQNLRQQFKEVTGINATDNPAAFIAYINGLQLNIIANGINNLGVAIDQLPLRLSQMG